MVGSDCPSRRRSRTNIRLRPWESTEDCAVMAPIPVRTTGVSVARSNPVRHVAEPTTNSPVRVSAMRMDHVAEAGVAARAVVRAVAASRRDGLMVLIMVVYIRYLRCGVIPREIGGWEGEMGRWR